MGSSISVCLAVTPTRARPRTIGVSQGADARALARSAGRSPGASGDVRFGRGRCPVREYMIRADCLRFHIVEWGDPRDPTVLLLHGRSANATSWHRFAVGLSDRHRVVAFDQRGHGLSGWYSDRLLVADVMRVVDAVPIDRFTLWATRCEPPSPGSSPRGIPSAR